MSTYKVEISGEFEGLACVGGADLMVNGIPIRLPDSLLTEVVPPLPEEPPAGAVVQIDQSWVFHRGSPFRGTDDHWYEPGFDMGYMWSEVCAKGTPVRLVPEPVVEPVTLPWKNDGVEVRQTLTDSGPGNRVHVSTKAASYGFAHLKPDVADAMAAALTAAAAKARRS